MCTSSIVIFHFLEQSSPPWRPHSHMQSGPFFPVRPGLRGHPFTVLQGPSRRLRRNSSSPIGLGTGSLLLLLPPLPSPCSNANWIQRGRICFQKPRYRKACRFNGRNHRISCYLIRAKIGSFMEQLSEFTQQTKRGHFETEQALLGEIVFVCQNLLRGVILQFSTFCED